MALTTRHVHRSNSKITPSLINSCTSKSHLRQITTSSFQNPSISSTFLSRAAHAHAHDLPSAHQLFDQIPHPNVFNYNALLKAYSQSPNPQYAFYLYRNMLRRNVLPNAFSSSFVVKSCTNFGSLSCGKQVHCRILRDEHHSDSVLSTSLMSLYAMCGDGEDARQMFDEMEEKDTVAWNVLISCFTRNKRMKDALQLFDEMQRPGDGMSEPDDVTCLLLHQACAQLNALEFGERIHKYAEDKGYTGLLKVRNTLISMYSRCGAVDKAEDVFYGKNKKMNVVTWSAMISGWAMNGYGWDALKGFCLMQRLGYVPDELTFTGVLSACSHSGLVEEGLRFFKKIINEYRIVPNVHHYGCIVDLLGREGWLDDAYKLIVSDMGAVELNATIWRTLLGACRIHGHVQLGERVIEHLIELKAQQASDYVLLLNIYASAGNWEKVAYLRRLMKDNGIQTTPGCTTIELQGKLHEFIVDDVSHPRKVEIYEKLAETVQQLKIDGYVANVSSELHDMDADEKESALSFHSEKLAIAFGVLSTPPGTSIRIANNLRICADCHNFIKMYSSVYSRLVVVRDRNRFHRVRDGKCSCYDYW